MQTIALKQNKKLSFKAQTAAAAIAIVSAVVLPQLFHLMGSISGTGAALGETFLPMHLPIIATGLFAGPYAAAAAGIVSPLISFALTGMPAASMLPFMMIELCIYGFVSGALRNVKMPVILKVVIAQVAGRAVRAAAILIAFYGFESTAVPVSVIWNSILTGIFGIVLQWAILPLAVYRFEKSNENDG